MLTIEFEPPQESDPCKCCGGRTTALTRFVYRDGDAHSVYFARFSDNHPERVVLATISIGGWGENTTPEQRVAFALKLHLSDGQYQVGLLDAQDSPWGNEKFIGRTLNRDEALKHPLVKEAFDVTDHIVVDDLPIHEYLNGR